jgi:hypothetical protein
LGAGENSCKCNEYEYRHSDEDIGIVHSDEQCEDEMEYGSGRVVGRFAGIGCLFGTLTGWPQCEEFGIYCARPE